MRVNTQNEIEPNDNILSTIDPNSDIGIYIGSLLSRIQNLSNLYDGAVSIIHRLISRENDELREEIIARLRQREGSF